MSDHETHASHDHTHGPGCGHRAVKHDGHVDEHTLSVDASHPSACTPSHACGAHDASHTHGADCGHESVPHGDHVDYLVGGHLHHPHDGHCDDHGGLSSEP